MNSGQSWIVDAFECDASRLRSTTALAAVFGDVAAGLKLRALGAPAWHQFPEPGGVTGFVLLTESHFSCHTFPENAFAAFDLYCCRDLPEWPWMETLRLRIGARRVVVHYYPRGRANANDRAR